MQLWALRLAALARLRLYNHASAETSALFSALATIQPPAAQTYILNTLLPVELELARARERGLDVRGERAQEAVCGGVREEREEGRVEERLDEREGFVEWWWGVRVSVCVCVWV